MLVETKALLNSIGLSVIGSALSFLAAWFWFQKKKAQDKAAAAVAEAEKIKARLTELETKLALVQQAVVPITTAFQAILIKELTHYHTPEMDELMQRIGPPNTLTKDEENRLFILLEERTRDMGPLISASERNSAVMLPLVMMRVHAENEAINNPDVPVTVQTVASVDIPHPDMPADAQEEPKAEPEP